MVVLQGNCRWGHIDPASAVSFHDNMQVGRAADGVAEG